MNVSKNEDKIQVVSADGLERELNRECLPRDWAAFPPIPPR